MSPNTVGANNALTFDPKKNFKMNCLTKDLKNLSLNEKKLDNELIFLT
jgi:hypothetical protein